MENNIKENVDFVDEELGTLPAGKEFPRTIRLKSETYKSVVDKYGKFLSDKDNKVAEESVSTVAVDSKKEEETTPVEVNSVSIDDKINVLPEYDLAEKYGSRPIKLSSRMISAAKAKSDNIYKDSTDKKEEIKVEKINKDTIKDSILQGFDELNKKEEEKTTPTPETTPVEETTPVQEEVTTPKEEITTPVTEDSRDDKLDREHISQEIDKKLNEIYDTKVEATTPKEESHESELRIPIPDIPTKDLFKPADKSVRDSIVIAPEREEKHEEKIQETPKPRDRKDDESDKQYENFLESYYDEHFPKKEETKEEKKTDLHFDFNDATPKDINNYVDSKEVTVDSLEAIKERIRVLKIQQEEISKERVAAVKRAEEFSNRAAKKKAEYKDKQKEYEDKKKLLSDYADALAENNERDRASIEAINESAASDERFTKDQDSKINDINSMISDIDSIVGPVATNTRKR